MNKQKKKQTNKTMPTQLNFSTNYQPTKTGKPTQTNHEIK
jgi:hypothetical protein